MEMSKCNKEINTNKYAQRSISEKITQNRDMIYRQRVT